MNWLTRLKKIENAPTTTLQNLQKEDSGAFVGFVGTPPAPFQNSTCEIAALPDAFPAPANDAALTPMTTDEERMIRAWLAHIEETDADAIAQLLNDCQLDATARAYFIGQAGTVPGIARTDTDTARLILFTDRGLNLDDAEAMTDRLALRDSQHDERRACIECLHLSGTTTARRCHQWRMIGVKGPSIPADLVTILQRCAGFTHKLKETA
ncbi:hypothetical protein ACFDR9_004498 [Janthinobacterium sp. CG_23.3]|uniref:hypothetical protein n=1 Tax=Janthinobacterium sp. CG_23.3 TaxID=3349634 RepID=UPI0038D4C72E